MAVIGNVSVKLKIEGKILVISEVYYAPELKNHLFSIGLLQEKWLKVVSNDNKFRVYHKQKSLIMQSLLFWFRYLQPLFSV